MGQRCNACSFGNLCNKARKKGRRAWIENGPRGDRTFTGPLLGHEGPAMLHYDGGGTVSGEYGCGYYD